MNLGIYKNEWLKRGGNSVEEINFDTVGVGSSNLSHPTIEFHESFYFVNRSRIKKEVVCPICHESFEVLQGEFNKGRKFCSQKCSSINLRRTLRPSRERLKSEISIMNWCSLGRKYGVSDNAVRKWARQYGLI